jgi:hypothetical protein
MVVGENVVFYRLNLKLYPFFKINVKFSRGNLRECFSYIMKKNIIKINILGKSNSKIKDTT